MNTKNMTNEQLREYVARQCGYNPPTNKAKHRQDLQVKLSPERLEQLESICQRHPARPYKAEQVCNAGDWPEHLPSSFEDWLKSNSDSIDIGGNEIPDRVKANHDRYNIPF